MIKLTKFDKKVLIVNPDIIETIEATPDTVITLVTGKKFLVVETIDEIIEKVLQYKNVSGKIPVPNREENIENFTEYYYKKK